MRWLTTSKMPSLSFGFDILLLHCLSTHTRTTTWEIWRNNDKIRREKKTHKKLFKWIWALIRFGVINRLACISDFFHFVVAALYSDPPSSHPKYDLLSHNEGVLENVVPHLQSLWFIWLLLLSCGFIHPLLCSVKGKADFFGIYNLDILMHDHNFNVKLHIYICLPWK